MAAKRKLEFRDSEDKCAKTCNVGNQVAEAILPSSIQEPASEVTVCALVTSLSPMRNKRFTGELVDEQRSIRRIGFDQTNQSKLKPLTSQNMPVKLTNWDIQHLFQMLGSRHQRIHQS